MKAVFITLGIVILLLQIRLLSSDGGVGEYFSLQSKLEILQAENNQLMQTNLKLKKEVIELQSSSESIEAIARKKLGMVAEDEVFIKVIKISVPPNKTIEQ